MMLLSLLFAGLAAAHTGLRTLLIDGQLYPSYDYRIDHLVGPVKRIGWNHDIGQVTFNPITNYSDPAIACRANAKVSALKAPARAGSEISLMWTPITRMHHGPSLAYLAELPSSDTPATELKFFKIFEAGFDATQDKWGNQLASDHGDSYRFQIPSDIKPGTYVLRTELIALHGNMKELKEASLRGQVQLYPYCFTLEISGTGSVVPEGVKFPGAYKPTDPGLTFAPFMTYGNDVTGGTEHNKKYVTPGPPKYNGKYDAPVGPRATVKETGQYPPDLEVTYQDLIRKIERPALKLATYINAAWPHYKADEVLMKGYGKIGQVAIGESRQVMTALKADIEAFKKASHAA